MRLLLQSCRATVTIRGRSALSGLQPTTPLPKNWGQLASWVYSMTRHFTLMDFNTWWISIPDGSGISPVFLFQYLAVSSSIQVFQMKPILKALINTSVRVNLTASQRNTGVCEIDGCFSICLRKIKNVWFSGVWWNSLGSPPVPPSPPVPFKCPINLASFFLDDGKSGKRHTVRREIGGWFLKEGEKIDPFLNLIFLFPPLLKF